MSDSKPKKISAYVPKKLHEKLEETAKEENISISQVIIGALVKAYNFEDIEIGRASRRIIVGADTETKKRVENLENKLDKMTQLLEQMLPQKKSNNSSTNGEVIGHKHPTVEIDSVSEELVGYEQITIDHDGILKDQSQDEILDPLPQDENSTQLALASKTNSITLSRNLMALRLNVNKATISNYKRDHSVPKFKEWSASKDPDNIAWVPNEGKAADYSPSDDITEEQLSKLKEWLEKNPQ